MSESLVNRLIVELALLLCFLNAVVEISSKLHPALHLELCSSHSGVEFTLFFRSEIVAIRVVANSEEGLLERLCVPAVPMVDSGLASFLALVKVPPVWVVSVDIPRPVFSVAKEHSRILVHAVGLAVPNQWDLISLLRVSQYLSSCEPEAASKRVRVCGGQNAVRIDIVLGSGSGGEDSSEEGRFESGLHLLFFFIDWKDTKILIYI